MATRVLRAGVVLLVDACLLLLLSQLLDGFTLDGPAAALGTAALVGVLNALIWPFLARLALPLNVVTLGLASLVLNGALVMFAIDLIPGASLRGLGTGMVIALGLAALTALLSALLAIDEDDTWYRNVVRGQLRRRGERVESEVPGILFLEIDGLAHDVLRRALRDGSAPTMARWMREGTHRLVGWETDLSSQTGACQAGLLHGDNDDMAAFRWWEKDRGRPIVTNHPKDAQELERRHSDGEGLLHADGASRANILFGDAPHSMLTMSTVLHRRRPIGRDYFAYFARPYAVARTLALIMADVARERHAQAHQRRRDVQPRIHRSRGYALMRAFGTVIQRDLQVAAVVGDLLAGRPVIYTTFLAYDEVAHHSGIDGPTRWPSSLRSTARSPVCRRRSPTPRGRTGWSCSPTTVSRRAEPSATATTSPWRNWCVQSAMRTPCTWRPGARTTLRATSGRGSRSSRAMTAWRRPPRDVPTSGSTRSPGRAGKGRTTCPTCP